MLLAMAAGAWEAEVRDLPRSLLELPKQFTHTPAKCGSCIKVIKMSVMPFH